MPYIVEVQWAIPDSANYMYVRYWHTQCVCKFALMVFEITINAQCKFKICDLQQVQQIARVKNLITLMQVYTYNLANL